MLGLRELQEEKVVVVRRRCWVRCRTELRGEKEGRPLLFSMNKINKIKNRSNAFASTRVRIE